MLITIDTPKPISRVAGIVNETGGERTNTVSPMINIAKPNQLAFSPPNLWAIRGLAQPAKIDAIPIAVPCNPATVNEVP